MIVPPTQFKLTKIVSRLQKVKSASEIVFLIFGMKYRQLQLHYRYLFKSASDFT